MPIIDANNISCLRGNFSLFEPVTFALDGGEALLVSGANGIGKTTLLEAIAGLRAYSDGDLFYHDQNLLKYKDKWLDDNFYIGHKTGNKKELNCLENLRSFLQIQRIEISLSQAENALKQVGMAGFEYQMAGKLSAGQKKRLALARLIVINHSIWILDEPFVNLDVDGCAWLHGVLNKHLANNGILIITAHDNKTIKDRATKELILEPAE